VFQTLFPFKKETPHENGPTRPVKEGTPRGGEIKAEIIVSAIQKDKIKFHAAAIDVLIELN